MKYVFFTALWEGSLGHSKAYFDHILDLQLRVIGEELKDEEVEYHIVGTKQEDVELYRSILEHNQSIRNLGANNLQPKISLVPIDDRTPPQIKLNYLSQQFIKERENSGDVLIYNVPDYVYSKGTFNWVKKNLAAGAKICSIYTPKVIRELALESIDSLESISLWNSVKEDLHVGHQQQFSDSEVGYIKYPSGVYYRTGNGFVCFPITMHPFAFRLDRRYSTKTFDARCAIEQELQGCYVTEEFALQSDIRDFIILELTKMELPWADDTDYSGYSHELIVDWFRFGEMGSLQRRFLEHKVYFDTYSNKECESEIFHQELIKYVDKNYYDRRNQ